MGVEVKSGGEGVIVADRGCNDGCCCNKHNSGWGSGWGAVGGALVGGGFGAAVTSRMANRKIKCLIENTAKDQEIARLNRVVDAQRDQNIIQSVVAALKTISTTPA